MLLMFLWNISRNINDVLVPHLKRACQLTDFQSSLVQSAFFGAYFLCALPVGYFLKKRGYQAGIVTGLCLAAVGGFLFYPAAETRFYPVFLLALFVMAAGFTFLEVSATPYVSVLGSPQTAASRLNLAAACGSLGSTLGPLLGGQLILHQQDVSEESLRGLSPDALTAFLDAEANSVKAPYLTLALFLLGLGVVIARLKLPPIQQTDSSPTRLRDVLRFRHTVLGAVAVFCYLGAEVGTVSFMIRYLKSLDLPGITEQKAATFISLYMAGVLIGRLAGAVLLRRFRAGPMLGLVSGVVVVLITVSVLSSGWVAVWSMVSVGLFTSVMYGIIFTLSIAGLGPHTEQGSSLLIMSIVGGAIVPPLMGLISDYSTIRWAFVVPLICYFYLIYYGLSGYKPAAFAKHTI
ncbi:glucose transporter [Spirosoma montaniterrae]|uniref:Glucose transporter n=2 Tax=Spirosoma montaniterrae TaxID=1178516 RepID=A0A1P9X4Y0_9BACT|nr:glucose transporter [Spirosoma montaniterrae]